MLMKPDPTPPNPSAACGNCGAEERRLLHHVRHRGVFRRLCTTCVLRLHPNSFCPTCFQVYPPLPPNDAVFSCHKCYSSTHSHCVLESPPPTPYICSLCLHPAKPVFHLKPAPDGSRIMDRDATRKLLAAAKIASASMNKAAVAAKAEAERRAKEAAFTRKRAKEALEHVAHLVMRKRADALAAATGHGFSGAGGGVGYPAIGGVVKVERDGNATAGNRNGNGSAVAGLGPSMVVEEKIDNLVNVNGAGGSNQVLPTVGLRENEKIGGVVTEQSVARIDSQLMDVDEKGGCMMGENVGGLVGERSNNNSGGDQVNPVDMESVAENVTTQEDDLDDVNGDAVLVADQRQYEENNNVEKQPANGGLL